MNRDPRQFDEQHCKFIRELPCVICGDNTSTECAHIRMGDMTIAKQQTGMQTKPHDRFTIPLCGVHHREQHTMRERTFWERQGIDPIKKALALYAVSSDCQRGEEIVRGGR